MATKQILNSSTAPDGSQYVTLTDGAGNLVTIAGGGGGTVTTVSVVSANGVSGTVATATTTPAITLTLGAITPSSLTMPIGAAATPTLVNSGSATTGFYWTTSTGTGIGFSQAGVTKWDYNITSASTFTLSTGVNLAVVSGTVTIPSLALGGAGTITWATRTVIDTNSTDGAIRIKNNAGTSTFTLQATGAAAPIKFVDAGSFTANSTTAVTLTALGPAGASTTVTKWLTIVDNGGTTRYIPCF